MTADTTVKLDRPVASVPWDGAAVHTQVEPVVQAVHFAANQVNDVMVTDASDDLRPNSKEEKRRLEEDTEL